MNPNGSTQIYKANISNLKGQKKSNITMAGYCNNQLSAGTVHTGSKSTKK
jgi:hypothetical protein